MGVVDGLVDVDDPAAAAVLRAVRRFHDLGDWVHPWLPGYGERWAFVDRGAIAEVIAEKHRAIAPKRNRSERGCGGCGVAEAAEWRGDVLTRASEHRQLCLDCAVLLERAGGMGERFDDALAARAAGLTGAPMDRFAERIGFRSHAFRCPDDPGSRAPFEWLGSDLPRLREWAAERWPALVAGADPAQVQAAQRAGLRARLEQEPARSSLALDGRP